MKSDGNLNLESVIEFYHRYYFAHYINNNVPEFRESLVDLMPLCNEVFGNINDIEANIPYINKDGLPYTQFIFNTVFDIRNDPTLSLHLFERFSSKYKTIKSKREKIQNLNEPHTTGEISSKNIEEDEKILFEKLDQFRKLFRLLLEKFHLNQRWLALVVFQAIWDETGILKLSPELSEKYPLALLDDIRRELAQSVGNTWKREEEFRYLEDQLLPRPLPFRYEEYLWLLPNGEESSKTVFELYEENAVNAYRDHIRQYVSLVYKLLKKHGYRQPSKPFEYSRVQWLVLWTVKGWTKDQILQRIEDQKRVQNDNFSEHIEADGIVIESKPISDISTINKAFAKFREYRLPVRNG